MQEASETITLSIVVPVYSGSEYLGDLVDQIEALRTRWRDRSLNLMVTETVFVLDDPLDDSRATARTLSNKFAWLRCVELSRNFGQHNATVAGILHTSGDWVVTMDEDLQHPPAGIEALLIRLCEAEADVVYALPSKWVHGGGYRDRMSRMVKYLIARFSGNRFVQSFNSFRLMRGDIARAASSVCAQKTYFDVALSWFTQRIATAEMELADERYGTRKASGYRLSTLIEHAMRLILTSDFKVLRFTSVLSGAALVGSLVYGLWVIYRKYFAPHPVEVQGWASLMIVILGLGSVTIFFLGLIIEFLHTNMLQLQGKPTFFVVDRALDPALLREVAKLNASCAS